jgi:hypothetical protein
VDTADTRSAVDTAEAADRRSAVDTADMEGMAS